MTMNENSVSYDAPALAQKLIEKGFEPIPVPNAEKGPRIPNWQKRSFTAADFLPNANVGIRTGDRGVALLDIDVEHEDSVEHIVEKFQANFAGRGFLLRRTGKSPKTGILFRSEEGLTKRKTSLGEGLDIVEVLAKGQQFIAFGVHPETRSDYKWHGADPTSDELKSVEDLAFVSAQEVDEFLDSLKERYLPGEDGSERLVETDHPAMAEQLMLVSRQVSLDRKIIGLLNDRRNILGKGSYDDWLKIAFSVRSKYYGTALEEEAKSAFFDWSSRWENGETEEEKTAKLWSSWKPHWKLSNGQKAIGPGTAVKLLRAMPARYDQTPWEPLADEQYQKPKLEGKFTGLAKQLLTVLQDASDRQPNQLQVAGVVATLGALIGPAAVLQNGVKGPCCSNLYILALAYTGAGKEDTRKIVAAVLRAAERSSEVYDASPSEVSCHSALAINGGRMTLMVDEAGMLAKSIKAGSHGHQQSLMNFMTSAYGLGLTGIKARVYHEKKKNIGEVEHPRPIFMMTSTEREFTENISPDSATNGFLNRFLAFIEPSHVALKPRNKAANGAALIDLPDEIVKAARRLSGIHVGPKLPERLPEVKAYLTDDALEFLLDLKHGEVENKLRLGGVRAGSWVRAIENLQRLATCLAVSDALVDPNSDLSEVQCSLRHVELAKEVVFFSCEMIEKISSRAGQSLSFLEGKKDSVLKFIEQNRGVATKTQLGRGPLRGMQMTQREDLLEAMVLDGELDQEDIETGGRKATLYKVRS